MPSVRAPFQTQCGLQSSSPYKITNGLGCAVSSHCDFRSWHLLQSLAAGVMGGVPTHCYRSAPSPLPLHPSSFCRVFTATSPWGCTASAFLLLFSCSQKQPSFPHSDILESAIFFHYGIGLVCHHTFYKDIYVLYLNIKK